jgi:hypothetical protein
MLTEDDDPFCPPTTGCGAHSAPAPAVVTHTIKVVFTTEQPYCHGPRRTNAVALSVCHTEREAGGPKLSPVTVTLAPPSVGNRSGLTALIDGGANDTSGPVTPLGWPATVTSSP